VSDLGGAVAVTRQHERRKLLWAGGTIFDIVLGGEHTGGSLALLDQWGSQGDATPLHIHRREAEVFYVLDGAVTAWVGDAVREMPAGSAVYLPAALPHAIRVDSPRARILTITTPAGFSDFVREAGVVVEGEAPPIWEFDLQRIMTAAPRHDIEILGPPPGKHSAGGR